MLYYRKNSTDAKVLKLTDVILDDDTMSVKMPGVPEVDGPDRTSSKNILLV